MTIKEFEVKIKNEIDSDLNIRLNPNSDDIAGVYWKDCYIGVAIPPQEIKEVFSPKYHDNNMVPYRNIQMTEELIKGKLPKFQDPEVYKMMTTK